MIQSLGKESKYIGWRAELIVKTDCGHKVKIAALTIRLLELANEPMLLRFIAIVASFFYEVFSGWRSFRWQILLRFLSPFFSLAIFFADFSPSIVKA